MDILPADAPLSLAKALAVLANGGVVVHATETCYGLACDLRNPTAVARLFAVKQRPIDQPVSALFTSIDEAKKFVEWNDRAQALATEFLPGPLTLILPARKNIATPLYTTALQAPLTQSNQPATSPSERPAGRAGNQQPETIGLRISSHSFAMGLVQAFGSPLSTTSANIHGKPSPYSVEEILEQYKDSLEKPDIILDSGSLPFRKPSRIIDCTGTSDILRRP